MRGEKEIERKYIIKSASSINHPNKCTIIINDIATISSAPINRKDVRGGRGAQSHTTRTATRTHCSLSFFARTHARTPSSPTTKHNQHTFARLVQSHARKLLYVRLGFGGWSAALHMFQAQHRLHTHTHTKTPHTCVYTTRTSLYRCMYVVCESLFRVL